MARSFGLPKFSNMTAHRFGGFGGAELAAHGQPIAAQLVATSPLRLTAIELPESIRVARRKCLPEALLRPRSSEQQIFRP